jgi:hypothetical protein
VSSYSLFSDMLGFVSTERSLDYARLNRRTVKAYNAAIVKAGVLLDMHIDSVRRLYFPSLSISIRQSRR